MNSKKPSTGSCFTERRCRADGVMDDAHALPRRSRRNSSPAFTSPEPDCGKSTSLSIIQLLVLSAVPSVNISPAAMFRTIERHRPTLLVDEADTLLADNEELRAVLNSGHSRSSAFVLRCEGDDPEPRLFGTWAAVATAAKDSDSGKSSLPDTVLSSRRHCPHAAKAAY